MKKDKPHVRVSLIEHRKTDNVIIAYMRNRDEGVPQGTFNEQIHEGESINLSQYSLWIHNDKISDEIHSGLPCFVSSNGNGTYNIQYRVKLHFNDLTIPLEHLPEDIAEGAELPVTVEGLQFYGNTISDMKGMEAQLYRSYLILNQIKDLDPQTMYLRVEEVVYPEERDQHRRSLLTGLSPLTLVEKDGDATVEDDVE
jgi:hypothetical protein